MCFQTDLLSFLLPSICRSRCYCCRRRCSLLLLCCRTLLLSCARWCPSCSCKRWPWKLRRGQTFQAFRINHHGRKPRKHRQGILLKGNDSTVCQKNIPVALFSLLPLLTFHHRTAWSEKLKSSFEANKVVECDTLDVNRKIIVRQNLVLRTLCSSESHAA